MHNETRNNLHGGRSDHQCQLGRLGLYPMLAILLTTLILGAIGYVLDIMGYSLNKFTSKMLEKISN